MNPKVLENVRADLECAQAVWLESDVFDETIDLCPKCHGPAILFAWMDASSLYDPYREVQMCFNCGYDTQICECKEQNCRDLNDILRWTKNALAVVEE